MWLAALAACLVFVSCSQEGTNAASRATPSSGETIDLDPERVPPSATERPEEPDPDLTFAPARVLIDTADGSVIVDAEKAETPEQRTMGLRFRDSLGPDEGMVFLFFQPTETSFVMGDVTFPLSIAFFDEEGTILEILDMEPCRQDPCPAYTPRDEDGSALAFYGALEVNQGKFEEWGVEIGDRITVTH